MGGGTVATIGFNGRGEGRGGETGFGVMAIGAECDVSTTTIAGSGNGAGYAACNPHTVPSVMNIPTSAGIKDVVPLVLEVGFICVFSRRLPVPILRIRMS